MSDPARWLEEHGDYLFRYARPRLLSDELAEEAVQETLLAALKAHQQFAGSSSVRTWLTGILKHKIVDLIRTHSRELTAAGGDDEDAPGDWESLFDRSGHWVDTLRDWGNPHSELEKSRIRKALDECFRRLKPSLANIFSLRQLSGLWVGGQGGEPLHDLGGGHLLCSDSGDGLRADHFPDVKRNLWPKLP